MKEIWFEIAGIILFMAIIITLDDKKIVCKIFGHWWRIKVEFENEKGEDMIERQCRMCGCITYRKKK